MTTKYLITIIFSLLSSHFVFADEPPCWCKFEINSNNHKFIAVVDRVLKDSLKDPWNAKWTLSVYEKTNSRKLVWVTPYKYSGYPDGKLSDDGKYFVYVEYWFYESTPLIRIYKNGKEINSRSLTGASFNISKYELKRTVSHTLWLSDTGESHFQNLAGQLAYVLTTIDKRKHLIDLQNGVLLSSK